MKCNLYKTDCQTLTPPKYYTPYYIDIPLALFILAKYKCRKTESTKEGLTNLVNCSGIGLEVLEYR